MSNATPFSVSDNTFQKEVIDSELPVLVDFWAPWCAPCKMIAPFVEELATEFDGRVKFAKVNTDDNQLNAGQLGIRGIPTLILFKNGKETDRVVGAVPKQKLSQMIEKNI